MQLRVKAWCPKNNKMYYPDTLSDMRIYLDCKSGKFYELLPDSQLRQRDFIPLLSTGVLDRNGREIYNGDVLLGKFGNAGSGAKRRKTRELLCKVEWYIDKFVLCCLEQERQLQEVGGSWFRFYPRIPDCVYAGTVYENPELLNDYKFKRL